MVGKTISKTTLIPAHLTENINELPNTAGVYFFLDKNNRPLYIGKSIHIQTRVKSHFYQTNENHKIHRLKRATLSIRAIETAGEHTALFLEAELIKRYQPIFNRRLRRQKGYCSLVIDDTEKFHSLKWTFTLDVNNLANYYGLYQSKRQALAAIETLCDESQLCRRRCGIKGLTTCFKASVNQCHAVCASNESADVYNARLKARLAHLQLSVWPYAGPIALKESCAHTGLVQYILLDNWCYLGINSEPTLSSDMRLHNKSFDRDIYWLANLAITQLSISYVR